MIAAIFIVGLAMAYWPQENPEYGERATTWADGSEAGAEKGEPPVVWAQGQVLTSDEKTKVVAQFDHCGMVRRTCVVDGDTIWLEGNKIRIADIDTPEVSQPQCQLEKQLGDRATDRLIELLNAGPFELRTIGDRDTDQYGRNLRVLVRDGRSLGDQLVSEGLARTWTGRREPWC